MATTTIGFRPTAEDERILRDAARPGESATETLRRALRLLDHDRWLEQFRADAEVLVDEPSGSPSSVVTVVPTSTSTSAGPSIHRPELEVAGRTTRFPFDQVRSIDVTHVHGDPVDLLNRDELAEVELALAHYLGVQASTACPSPRPDPRGPEGS